MVQEKKKSDVSGSTEWWVGATIYQIYIKSFSDSNGDGLGDINGIRGCIPYLASLGVDAIWITPFYASPQRDGGYDVSDYESVDPCYGSLADFSALVRDAHAVGLKVIIDQVFSHTSSDHRWFQESRLSRDNVYADWYVWKDPRPDGTPPNNWLSVFGGPAWHWDALRSQYYLHKFLPTQPDLNLHVPAVREALLSAAKFWLDLGVDGFRLDVANYYLHDESLPDNPPLITKQNLAECKFLDPYYMQEHRADTSFGQEKLFLKSLRQLTDKMGGRLLMGELLTDTFAEDIPQYVSSDKLQTAYSFALLREWPGVEGFKQIVKETCATGLMPTWAFDNHDVIRIASRWFPDSVGPEKSVALLTLLLSLPGMVCMYQGEELGLEDAPLEFEDIHDPFGKFYWPVFKGRDGARTPMPWSDKLPYGGFSTCEHVKAPWLPVCEKQKLVAVSLQEEDDSSVLHSARALLALRKARPSLRTGSIQFLSSPTDTIFIERVSETERARVIINLCSSERKVAELGVTLRPWQTVIEFLPVDVYGKVENS